MPPPGNSMSIPSQIPEAKSLINHSQSTNSLKETHQLLPLTTRRILEHVPDRAASLPTEQKSIRQLILKLRIPSLSTHLKTITRQQLSPAQALCKARHTLLKDKDKFCKTHPLRGRMAKNSTSLELIPQHHHGPPKDCVFPPIPPVRCLRGISRAAQRARIDSPDRKVLRSAAQTKLRWTQIYTVEYQLWEAREPRVLSGLGTNTFMGPAAQAPAELVQRWLAAKTELKQRMTFAAEDETYFAKHKLILVNPRTGLPIYWGPRFSSSTNSRRLYFFNMCTKRKQWSPPKGTDLLRFGTWFEEGFKGMEDCLGY